jgi:HSP20 family protein
MSDEEEKVEDFPEEEEVEGQLAIDAYQTEDAIIVVAPVAGVTKEDVEISITDEVVTIKGDRKPPKDILPENYFVQECYWGPFSRSLILPVPIEAEEGQAQISNGLLILHLPKREKTYTKIIKVKTE